jgi:hypothetical protein
MTMMSTANPTLIAKRRRQGREAVSNGEKVSMIERPRWQRVALIVRVCVCVYVYVYEYVCVCVYV